LPFETDRYAVRSPLRTIGQLASVGGQTADHAAPRRNPDARWRDSASAGKRRWTSCFRL